MKGCTKYIIINHVFSKGISVLKSIKLQIIKVLILVIYINLFLNVNAYKVFKIGVQVSSK